MNEYYNCGYMWADVDEDGTSVGREYCHYIGPEKWAPCEQDEYEEEEEWW